MSKRKRASPQDVYYYKPLHIWAKCAGLLPNFDINALHALPTRPFWHGVLMALAFTTIYVYGSYGKVNYMRSALAPSIFVTDIGGDVALFVTNVTSIIRLSLYKAKNICHFLAHLKRIDVELRTISADIEYPRRIFLIEFVMANILFVIYYIYDAYIWVNSVTWQTYKWFFLRDVQCFHVVVLSLVVRNYSLAIRNRVKILNGLLLDIKPSIDKHNSLIFVQQEANNKNKPIPMVKHNLLNERWHVQKMRKIFAQICRSIEMFNDIFGWLYLVLYVAIVVYLLTSSNIALVYGIGNRKIGTSDFGWALLILCVLWSLLPLVIGFFIFSSADKVYFEIKRTPIICYSVIDDLATVDQGNVLIGELEKLAQQVANSHPEITAAGFFTVNYAIFFALIGSLSSYLIVLIQFM